MSNSAAAALKKAAERQHLAAPPVPMWHRTTLLVLSVYFCCTILFSLVVIKGFSGPLTGRAGLGEGGVINWDFVDHYEYTGYYVGSNLHFSPLPKLNLINNQAFYPYGTNSAFLSWAFERDIFFALLSLLCGIGPWLQIYYFLSIFATAAGAFLLLARDYGTARAAVAGFLVSFFNFYAVLKFPHHMGLAVLHWTVLGIIADFLIVKHIVLHQQVSLRLLLLRICLLVLALGQELGYVAGYSLLSFSVSAVYCCWVLARRCRRKPFWLTTELQNWKDEFRQYTSQCLLVAAMLLVFAAINIPLTLQLLSSSRDFRHIPQGMSFWASPFRLLIPYLPRLNPSRFNHSTTVDPVFADLPEALGAGSPGWLLVILGGFGLWQERKRLAIFIPLLIVLALCVVYHPLELPTLRVFPWFKFNRVGGRSTMIYPAVLTILALHISTRNWSATRKKVCTCFVIVLGSLELFTAYSFKNGYHPSIPAAGFYHYMNTVKQEPGEAVLDWPFCATAGNAPMTGADLCPFYMENSDVFALRRFHSKKVMGQYFGRLDPSQLQPYVEAGWGKLLQSDGGGRVRCFNPAEWQFFKTFFEANDFAGINLYTDLLSPGCAQEFHSHFGLATDHTTIPGVGKVEFIPKSADLRNHLDPLLGRTLGCCGADRLTALSVEVSCNDPSQCYKIGEDLWRAGQKRDALKAWEQAASRFPQEIAFVRSAALSRYELGDFNGAVRDYRKASSMALQDLGIRTDLAWALLAAKQFQETRSVCEDVLSREPGNEAAKAILARMEMQSKGAR